MYVCMYVCMYVYIYIYIYIYIYCIYELQVSYSSSGQSKKKDVPFVNGTSLYQTTLTQLLSGYTYNISVKAVRYIEDDKSASDEVSDIATTCKHV